MLKRFRFGLVWFESFLAVVIVGAENCGPIATLSGGQRILSNLQGAVCTCHIEGGRLSL